MKKVVIYDRNAEWYLKTAWVAGGLLVPKIIGVYDWEEAIQKLYNYSDGELLDIQSWTHGNDGKIYLGGQNIPLDKLADKLRGHVYRWWARSCETMRGEVGHDFAREFTIRMNAHLVGHCVVTSAPNPFVQGRICALKPGQGVWWSETGSELFNCSTLRMDVPAFAYEEGWKQRKEE